MTYTLRIALFAVSLTTLLACGDDTAPVCTAGMSVACVGPGGCAGGQACNAEGTGFGDCVCGGSDAGPGDTSVVETGIGDAGNDTGAGDAGPEDAGFDVGPPAVFDCNPLTGVPCEGETPRCTGVIVDDVTVFECVGVGEIAAGGTCEAVTGAADNCEAGTACFDVCAEFCDGTVMFDNPTCVRGGTCNLLTVATEEVPVGLCFM